MTEQSNNAELVRQILNCTHAIRSDVGTDLDTDRLEVVLDAVNKALGIIWEDKL